MTSLYDCREAIPISINSLVVRGAPSTATAHALYYLLLFQLTARDSTDTGTIKVGLFRLNAAETAELYESFKNLESVQKFQSVEEVALIRIIEYMCLQFNCRKIPY